MMMIGIPKEIKNNEFRVGLTPAGVQSLTSKGFVVLVQKNAGHGSGFSDNDYLSVGARIVPNIESVYEQSDMIIKVKEPLLEEYPLIKEDQLLYTYFHFAASESLTNAMIDRKAICIAYETIEDELGRLPLLTPMSEVAGRMATQEGAKYLEKPQGGLGILMGGVPGVPPAKVMVLGAGVVGTEAARMAAGLGADVTLYDINLDRLRDLDQVLPPNIKTQYSSNYAIEKGISNAHLIIGAVLIPGAKAPKLITKKMLKSMQKGTVLVDVAVDQGGCFETTTPTTHAHPTYVVDDVLHYAVANMPGAVPQTSTAALTHATLRYAHILAEKGWKKACALDSLLAKGLNIVKGNVVYQPVAEAFDLKHIPVNEVLK